MTSPEPHRARQTAESFGTDVDRYDRARPGYPAALIAHIVAASPGRDVLDVGCGTGIAARQLQAAGCVVLGVEPDPRMADFARARGVDVEVATFEAWEPDGRRFDAVVAGQSWHWVDPVMGAAKAAEVLRPGGVWAIFGHVFEPPEPIAEALHEACRRLVPDFPFAGRPARDPVDAYQAMYAGFADRIEEHGGFAAVEHRRFVWQQDYTRDQWLDLLPTTGGLTRLAPDRLAQILASVGAAIDRIGGRFTMTYTTLAATAVRMASNR